MVELNKIGLGGGCHWCTEAIFQSLIGVEKVEQGWIASSEENNTFSEAIIIHFDSAKISLNTLIEIHLYTHSSTSNHSMRKKYRSAIYTFSEKQNQEAKSILIQLQEQFFKTLITQVLPFVDFKLNQETFLNYYKKNPEKAFCKKWIDPKLKLIFSKYSKFTKSKNHIHI